MLQEFFYDIENKFKKMERTNYRKRNETKKKKC